MFGSLDERTVLSHPKLLCSDLNEIFPEFVVLVPSGETLSRSFKDLLTLFNMAR